MPVMTSLPSSAESASGSRSESIGRTLAQPGAVSRESALDLVGRGRSGAELQGGLGPGLSVSRQPLRTQPRAGGDQLRERRDRVHVARLGDPDEAVRVEVVAE